MGKCAWSYGYQTASFVFDIITGEELKKTARIHDWEHIGRVYTKRWREKMLRRHENQKSWNSYQVGERNKEIMRKNLLAKKLDPNMSFTLLIENELGIQDSRRLGRICGSVEMWKW